MLLALAVATSAAKIDLPLGRSQSNLSLSHAVNFWALFALGPAPTVCIAAVSAWAQCTLRAGERNPLHRIVFSIASLTLTVVGRRPAAARWCMGADPDASPSLVRAAAVVAPLYFFVEHRAGRRRDRALDAAAGGRASGTATSCGARRATWPAPRSPRSRRRRRRAAGSDGSRCWRCRSTWSSAATTPSSRGCAKSRTRRAARWKCSWRPSRRSRWRSKPRPAARPSTSDRSSSTRRRSPKRSGLSDAEVQAVRTAALLHDVGNMAVPEHILVEARSADARGIRARQDSPARRRRDPAQRAVRRAGQRAGALPSRALGRPGLSGRAARRGHSARRAHPGDRRLLQHAAGRSAVPARPAAEARRSRCCASSPARRSIRRWWIC